MKSWILPVGAAVVAGLGIGWILLSSSSAKASTSTTTKPVTNTTTDTVVKPPVSTDPGTVKYDDAAAKAAAAAAAAKAAAAAAALAARRLAEERAKQLEAEAYNYLQQAQQAAAMGQDDAAENYKAQSDYLYAEAKKVRQDAGISVSTSGLFKGYAGNVSVGAWGNRNTVLAAHARRA